MTQFNPFLMLRRLTVIQGQHTAYDEFFHKGVNIIRGSNSSGKSTIADFIFYGLGGDITKLKNEAKQCNWVFCEVELSGKIFTLKREIKEGGRKGMDIFSGYFDDARNADITKWSRHPYNADKKESFYQVIFKELGIPYSKSDDKNSITMHQLLRMMYVDQMTSPDRLFRFDNFDSAPKREAIGELLVGLSDFHLYEKRVQLQRIEPKLDHTIRDIKTIHAFLGNSLQSLDEIEASIHEKQIKIMDIENEIQTPTESCENDLEEITIDELSLKIKNSRNICSEFEDQIIQIEFEINDSEQFISSLKERLVALKETRQTISALSDISFIHCPACQSQVTHQEHNCNLCGTSQSEHDDGFDPTFKVRKEIEFQIEESNKLIFYKKDLLSDNRIKLNQENTNLHNLKEELNVIKLPQRQVSLCMRKKICAIGALKNQIEYLNNNKEKYSKLYHTYTERDRLQSEVNDLQNEIKRLQARNIQALTSKKHKLSSITLDIIREDNHHEEVFNEGKKIEFDFAEDRVSIDDRALFSASSMVFLKNAFRMALLKASCEDNSYLYPRFLVMDNIEDKGMEEERSQLFQRLIIKLSDQLDVNHQIIFTTSMISPDLNNTKYCVGEFYHSGNKSLKV